MKHHRQAIQLARLPAALLLALGATTTFAQDGDASARTKNLDTVIVTGTHADNRTEASSLAPIDVVSSKVLRQSGTTELSTALARIIPSLTFPRPTAADTADSQRPAQLRGLSPDQVLVLVNGKRWHPGAILLTNGVLGRGSQAVDLNTIPVAAVDHIEVLRDGASAQYGSDAIAGVINVVLKKGAQGGEVDLTGGQYAAGDGRQWQGSANFGLPLNNDRGWIRFTLQNGHQDYTNRAEPNRTRPWEGTTQRYGDPAVSDHNLLLNAQYDLNTGAQLYAFGHIGNRNSTSPAFFRNLANSNSVPSLYPNGYLPLENADSTDKSLVVGVRGKTAGGWRWDVSGNYGGDRVSYATRNSVNRAFLHDFGTSPTAFHDGILRDSQQAFDVDLAKDFNWGFLPNPVTVAFGAEYLRQAEPDGAGRAGRQPEAHRPPRPVRPAGRQHAAQQTDPQRPLHRGPLERERHRDPLRPLGVLQLHQPGPGPDLRPQVAAGSRPQLQPRQLDLHPRRGQRVQHPSGPRDRRQRQQRHHALQRLLAVRLQRRLRLRQDRLPLVRRPFLATKNPGFGRDFFCRRSAGRRAARPTGSVRMSHARADRSGGAGLSPLRMKLRPIPSCGTAPAFATALCRHERFSHPNPGRPQETIAETRL
ncbi:TonB-dependent receptor plug domain-containing protein [Frateuria defendens]|uniref:TonB-dependent receptor plug domain-containing protein n=1 Tax=Frateuria defendens TaxID=2219559 RepID=UPI000A4E3870